jgi:hypothetical protein
MAKLCYLWSSRRFLQLNVDVGVRLTSDQNILSILTLERGKMGKWTPSAFILEGDTLIYIRSKRLLSYSLQIIISPRTKIYVSVIFVFVTY